MVLGLEVSVNGRRLCTAGTAGAAKVCVTVDALGEELRRAKPGHGPVVVRLGGLSAVPGPLLPRTAAAPACRDEGLARRTPFPPAARRACLS